MVALPTHPLTHRKSLHRYSTKADDEFIYFNQVVHLQLPLEALQSAEAAIFMEFKHYKVKKNKQSVKCCQNGKGCA